MTHPFDTDPVDQRIVYVRPVPAEDLPAEIRATIHGASEVYAIHDATGRYLGLAKDRSSAFLMARQNALAPVSVH